MTHKTFIKKDDRGNIIATMRVSDGDRHLLPKDIEEIDDDKDIAGHAKYYTKGT